MISRMMFAFLITPVLIAGASAGECCCGGDGQKVCKLECTTRTIEVTCYGCQCEDICIPGPSKKGCKNCECVEKCDLLCHLNWFEWCAGCAESRTIKRLTKYVVKREVPSYKWVVVDCCQGCEAQAGCAVKPAPETAQIGDEFPVTDKELQVLSKEVPGVKLSAAPDLGEKKSQSESIGSKLLSFVSSRKPKAE